MRRKIAVAAIGLAAVVSGALVASRHTSQPPPVVASPVPTLTRAQRMLVLINDARVTHGLPKVAASEAADEMALMHARHMAATQDLHHHGDYKWPWWGECVGVGDTVPGLFRGFMHSPSHRAIILGEFTNVGIGFAHRDGKLWTTLIFYRKTI
jgi:uncharacterized protein YkwD